MSSLLQKLLAGLSTRPEVPTIALLTDFGTRDPYVGTVKAVIAGINPNACVIDLAHDIAVHGVREAAYALWSSYRFFPPGTIFVAIVDPGVGSRREILIVQAGEFTFLAPENGVLDLVLSGQGALPVYSVRTSDDGGRWRRYALADVSRTFHGRDVFAPLAAHLSLGVRPEQLGEEREKLFPPVTFCDPVAGLGKPVLLHIDRFGNLITNIQLKPDGPRMAGLKVGRQHVRTWIGSYGEAEPGHPCLIVGSSGLVEVVVQNGSAAKDLKATLETTLTLLTK